MKKQYSRFGARLFWVAVLLAIWELSVKIFKVSPLLFPSVENVLMTLWESFTTGDLLSQSLYSVGIIGLGLIIALVLAFVLALLSVQSHVAGSLIDTITAIAHPLPGLALLPLIIMWFGTGSGAVLAIIVHSALWPILLNLITGFEAVPAIYLDTGRSLSMKPFAITCEIMVRSAAGYALSGAKIGWARAWRALISAEMAFGAVGVNGGIGWYILKQRTFMNTSGLFAGIVVVIVLGMLVEDVLFASIEKHTTEKWGM
ncbi:MAG: ABC transporter permease subunit [Angelakisella sp.]